MTLAARLAEHFRARPNQWIDGRTLAGIGGTYAWRTRLSDLRRAPYYLTIDNRQRREHTAEGDTFIVSEYRFRADSERTSSRNPDPGGGQPKVPTTDAPTSIAGGV